MLEQKNIKISYLLLCFPIVFWQHSALASNNVTKEYVDSHIRGIEYRIQNLIDIININMKNATQGPAGPAGPAGPPGPVGPRGPQGLSVSPGSSIDSGHLESSRAYSVGESAFGGVVFYVEGSTEMGAVGYHGLVAAKSDNSSEANWSGYGGVGTGYDLWTHARGNGIGSGRHNTDIIIAMQAMNAQRSKKSLSPFAAEICANYCVKENGDTNCSKISDAAHSIAYGDWYLPSAYELSEMWKSKVLHLAGQYWSSTEDSVEEAIFQNEYGQSYGSKYIGIQVRCIRSF